MEMVRELFRAYKEHDCFSLAANISFFAFLSFVPIMMIAMSVAGYLLGSSQGLFDQIVSTVTDVLPKGQQELSANLNTIISGRSQIGGVGVLFLIFIASLLFSSIEHALDRIFQSVKKRNFLHSRLLSVALVFGVISVLFLPTMVGLFEALLVNFSIHVPLVSIVTNKAFFVALLVALFIAAVMVIPNHDVEFRFAAAGGVFFAAGTGIAKYLFRWYIAQSFDRYNIIYGSLTVLIVSIVWVYYLANVLLISSELVAVLQRRYGSCPTNGVNGDRV